jgi:hypothetical protein
VLNAVAVTIAMYCVIQFYVQLRVPLAEHQPFLKVLAIKLVIFLSFWQAAAISVGTSTLNIVHPNQVLAYPDIKIGIPSLLLCFEMALFAVLHLWAFPYRPYLDNAKTTFYPVADPDMGTPPRENEHFPRSGGPLGLKALWDAMNLWDIIKAFGRGIRWLFVGVRHRHEDVSYHPTRKNSATGGMDMEDLNSKPGGRRFGDVDTSYGGQLGSNGAGKKSTDHLPIASEFRRSRFGMLQEAEANSDSGSGKVQVAGVATAGGRDERAGLIAHAQPEPQSPGVATPGWHSQQQPQLSPYRDHNGQAYVYEDDDVVDPRHAQQQQQQQQQPYAAHNSLSTVDEEPYGRPGPGGSRTSTQRTVGAALWGPQGGQPGEAR